MFLQRHRRAAALIVIALLSFAMLLPGLNVLTAFRQPELRVLMTAQDMADGGDWIIPHFEGELRLRKPPLMYWLSAAAMKVTGADATSPTAGRVPAVLMCTCLLLALCAFGARLIGPRRAFLAAIFGASSYLYIHHARLAQTDFTFTLFIVLACFTGFAAMTQPRSKRWWLATGALMGIGFMVKGPAALLVPILACVTYAIATPAKRSFALAGPMLGITALCIAIALPWYAAVLLKSGHPAEVINQIRTEVDKNYVDAHRPEPIVFYFYMLPQAIAPWSLLLPFALWSMWKRARHHAGTRFLLGWFVSSFLALTINPGKREHYITLIFAQTVLILGWYVIHLQRTHAPRLRKFANGYVLLLVGLLTLSGLGAIALPWIIKDVPVLPPLLIGLAISGIGVFGILRPQLHLRAGVITFCIALQSALFLTQINPRTDGRTLIPEFATAAAAALHDAKTVSVVGSMREPLEYYSDRLMTQYKTADEAWSNAAPRDVVIVTDTKARDRDLSPITVPPLLDQKREDTRLRLFVKPAP